MPLLDLPRFALDRYLPGRDEPADFDEPGSSTLVAAAAGAAAPEVEEVVSGLDRLVTYDVTFSGFSGQRGNGGWCIRPTSCAEGRVSRCR